MLKGALKTKKPYFLFSIFGIRTALYTEHRREPILLYKKEQSMSSREEKIEAAIAKAEADRDVAFKADRALASEIQRQIVVLQEDLRNERQRQHELQLATYTSAAESAVAAIPHCKHNSIFEMQRSNSFMLLTF